MITVTQKEYDIVMNKVEAKIRAKHGFCNFDMLVSAMTDSFDAVLSANEPVMNAIGLWVICAYRKYIDHIRKAKSYPDQVVKNERFFSMRVAAGKQPYKDLDLRDSIDKLPSEDKELVLALLDNTIGANQGSTRYVKGCLMRWYLSRENATMWHYKKALSRIREWHHNLVME